MINFINSIIEQFCIEGKFTEAWPVKVGHIHTSYRVATEKEEYFLQKINQGIFRDVDVLMRNLEIVTEKLRREYQNQSMETLEIIPARNQKSFVFIHGDYWRVYKYLHGLSSTDIPESSEEIYEAARAFASFSHKMKGVSTEDIRPTIDKFHHLSFRLQNLKNAVGSSTTDQLKRIKKELNTIEDNSTTLVKLEKMWKDGSIPERIVHNDTKFNNVMFDQSGKARCVVDLDTVMPGIVHFDLGDGIRTTSTTALEDERNLENIIVSGERLSAFYDGYLEGFEGGLNSNEIETLSLSGPYMAFIMGVRFLTDYLMGSIYYKIDYPDHNLIRAKSQLYLSNQLLRV